MLLWLDDETGSHRDGGHSRAAEPPVTVPVLLTRGLGDEEPARPQRRRNPQPVDQPASPSPPGGRQD